MASLVRVEAAWWQHGPVAFLRSPLFRALVVLGGLFCQGWLIDRSPTVWPLFLWGPWLVAGVFLLGRRWICFFGPVCIYDLVRSSRRGEPARHRCLYGTLLLLVLFFSYVSQLPLFGPGDWLTSLRLSPRVNPRGLAQFAEPFFAGFMLLQYTAVVLLTPIYVAGAIADQKERRTLDFLLVTDLSDVEIVLGMLAARLGKLYLLVLTGLPILSLLPLLGGVDPNLVLTGFVTTACLSASLGSISILASVQCRTVLGAVTSAYAVAPVLLGGSLVLVSSMPGCANPLWVTLSPESTGNLREARVALFAGLVVFILPHGWTTVVCSRAAVQSLRYACGALVPASQDADPRARPRRSRSGQEDSWNPGWGPYTEDDLTPYPARRPEPAPRYRPPVGPDALLWKEIWAEKYFASAAAQAPLGLGPRVAAVTLIVLILGLLQTSWTVWSQPAHRSPGDGLDETVQPLVRSLGIGVGCALAVAVALSAAGRISRERERRTLDSLQTLPVAPGAILFAKWLGSILSVRYLFWALALVWGLGLVTGGLSLVALPLLAAAWLVYAAFLASLGLWLSAVTGSTLRAHLFTLLGALLFLAGPGMVLMRLSGGSIFVVPSNNEMPWQFSFLDHGLTPAGGLWLFSFRTAELFDPERNAALFQCLAAAVAGLHVYLAGAVLLWLAALARLRRDKGPEPQLPRKS